MLSIQPKFLNNYTPAFKAYEESYDYSNINLEDMDEDTYESIKENLNEQKKDFLDLASGKEEFKMLKPAKKIFEGGAVITTGLLGGMATGWGTKKSIQGISNIAKSAPMQSFVRYMKDTRQFMKKALSNVKKEFLTSNVYKKPANAMKNQYDKFAKTKIGKPVTKFLEATKDGLETICIDIRIGLKSLWRKIKGVKKETYEKVVINTIGTSGGIAAGVTTLKENQEKNKKEEAAQARNNIYDDGEE